MEDKTVIESCSKNLNNQKIVERNIYDINHLHCNSINFCSIDENKERYEANILNDIGSNKYIHRKSISLE